MVKRYLEWLKPKGFSMRGTLEETIVRIANKGAEVRTMIRLGSEQR